MSFATLLTARGKRANSLLLPLFLALMPFAPFAPADQSQPRHAISSTLWLPPLGAPMRVSNHFSLPGGPYQAGHRGLDLPGSVGQTIRSPSSGTVTFVGWVVDRPVLSLRIDENTVASFEPVESELSIGDRVLRGAALGEIAAGGHCSERCLHLGVRVNDEYVNPLRYLRPRPVLLPW